jgi:hypothetical protein
MILSPRNSADLAAGALAHHVLGIPRLWPGAVLTNFVFLRCCRPKSWRHQEWRSWVAAGLAMVLIGLELAFFLDWRPAFQPGLPGGSANPLLTMSMTLLNSNLSIAIAWALPTLRRPVDH